MEIKNIEDLKKLPIFLIEKVYTGKAGHCCCGCSGKYGESPLAIKRMYRKFLNIPQENLEFGESYVSYETATRINIIYYKC